MLQASVELQPDRHGLRVRLGDLLESVAQDSVGAIEQWRQVLLDFPEVEEAQQALEARPFLRSRLVAIDAAREAAGEDVDAAMACHRIHDKEGEDMVLCD